MERLGPGPHRIGPSHLPRCHNYNVFTKLNITVLWKILRTWPISLSSNEVRRRFSHFQLVHKRFRNCCFNAGGNDDLMFHVNSHNGALLVVGEPDAERQNFYNLTLKLTDGINSAFTQVSASQAFEVVSMKWLQNKLSV